jgi:hypothetical protein
MTATLARSRDRVRTDRARIHDGTGELAHFQDKYIEAKLVSQVLVPAGRVIFNTVAQSRCPGVDLDGDPNFERSGPCQAKSVADFVAFYEACVTSSAAVLTDCRNDVLESIETCRDFEARDCTQRELTLSSGVSVTCSEVGMAAAMADMVPWRVVAPANVLSPVPGVFEPPSVVSVEDSVVLAVPPTSHFCAITGVRGALHGANFSVENFGTEWRVIISDVPPEAGRKPQFEITCSAWSNFSYVNFGGAWVSQTEFVSDIPALNGAGSSVQAPVHGTPFLAGVWGYLDEPQTEVYVTTPDSSTYAGSLSASQPAPRGLDVRDVRR